MFISTLSGVLDAAVYVPGYRPTGTDVGADLAQLISKINECATGINSNDVDIATNVSAIAAEVDNRGAADTYIQAQVTTNTASAADHETRITTEEGNVDTLQTQVAGLLDAQLGGALATTDATISLDYATYGDYGHLILNAVGSPQALTLPDPTSGGWSVGNWLFVHCANSTQASINFLDTADQSPASSNYLTNLRSGDTVLCIVISYGATVIWRVVKLKAIQRKDWYELTATGSITVDEGQHRDRFIVSGQTNGQNSTVTLPNTQFVIGETYRFVHVGANGTITLARTGSSDLFLFDGATDTSVVIGPTATETVDIDTHDVRVTATDVIGGGSQRYWLVEYV